MMPTFQIKKQTLKEVELSKILWKAEHCLMYLFTFQKTDNWLRIFANPSLLASFQNIYA